jgi:hypothetical protein
MQSRRRRRGAATSFISFLCLLLSTVIFFFLSLGRLQLSFGCSVLHFSLAFSSFFRAETADRRMRDGFCCVCSPLFLTVLLFAACVWGLYVRRCALTCPSSPPPLLSLSHSSHGHTNAHLQSIVTSAKGGAKHVKAEKRNGTWFLLLFVFMFTFPGFCFPAELKREKSVKERRRKRATEEHLHKPARRALTRTRWDRGRDFSCLHGQCNSKQKDKVTSLQCSLQQKPALA